MKSLIYAALAVLAFVYPASAQITLTKADFNSYIDKSARSTTYYTANGNALNELASKMGPNQIFDFSKLVYDDNYTTEETIEYLPGARNHPFVNVAAFLEADLVTRSHMDEDDVYFYNFFKMKDDGLYAIGTGEYDASIGLAVDYEVFDFEFLVEKFPQTFGTQWETNIPIQWEEEDFLVEKKRSLFQTMGANEDDIEMTLINSVDGWGTLILPNGGSYQALRATTIWRTRFMGFEFETKQVVFKTKEGHAADIMFDDMGRPVEASYSIVQWQINTADEFDRVDVPHGFALEQNYPNPFNPSTTISYSLPQTADVTLTVVDMAGRVVSNMTFSRQSAGTHQVQYDASKLSSGVYLYRIDAGGYSASRKFTLVK